MENEFEELIRNAVSARERAYAKYSGFAVGAAVMTAEGGEIFTGCNVENVSYGLTICAERSALVAAVGAGHRKFRALAVAADSRAPVSPCGACRQFMAEFGDFTLISANLAGETFFSTVGELLPRARDGILDSQEQG